MNRLHWLAPIGVLTIGFIAILLARFTALHGIWIHMIIVAPWSICLIWTWRWTLNWRSRSATVWLIFILILASVTGEAIQIWFPIHTIDVYGVIRNIIAAIAGTIIYIYLEYLARR